MISLQTDAGTFNYRSAAVIFHPSGDGRILSMRAADDTAIYRFLPGGRCELGETSAEAVVREVREELECEAAVDRLLFITENFFHSWDRTGIAHMIEFYYLVTLPADSPVYANRQSWTINDGGVNLLLGWQVIEETAFPLRPVFLKTELCKPLPLAPVHIMNDERVKP